MSVPALLAEMTDEGLRLLEKVAAVDPDASVEVLARLHVHLLAEWRERDECSVSSPRPSVD